MRALRVALACLLLALPGCLVPPSLPPRADGGARDAGRDAWLPTFLIVSVETLDARGHPCPSDAVPRAPVLRATFSSPPADPTEVLLVRGTDDPDLLDDADATPFRAATLDRAIPITRTMSGDTLTIVPTEPLEPGVTVTLVIPRWLADAQDHRLGAAFTRTVTVSSAPDAGARATDAWPPDGAFEVSPMLSLAAVRFDGTLDDAAHAVTLSEVRGALVACTPVVVPCASVGWTDGVCVTLVPVAPLAPSIEHVLAVAPGARDATGATLPAFASRFTTAAGPPAPLAWVPSECAIGERMDPAGCTRADDESITFRGQLSAAARVSWSDGSIARSLVAARGTVSLRAGDLAASTLTTLVVSAVDYAGATTTLTLPLATTEPLATIAITEVRADPAGPEPRQEFVEILNYGTAPVSLAGMHLADSATAIGDALPSVSVPAGAHALLVPADFDPDETAAGADVAAPAGALLVRLDASLGSGGLSNAGEPLFLRDAMDRWISAAPATPAPRQGVCIVRVSASRRVGDAGSFGYDPLLTCTPGR